MLEDDLEIAPDFFYYMLAGAALLRKDPSLWTMTAWNDNGLERFAKDPAKLYRSDFFGGLGWSKLECICSVWTRFVYLSPDKFTLRLLSLVAGAKIFSPTFVPRLQSSP